MHPHYIIKAEYKLLVIAKHLHIDFKVGVNRSIYLTTEVFNPPIKAKRIAYYNQTLIS